MKQTPAEQDRADDEADASHWILRNDLPDQLNHPVDDLLLNSPVLGEVHPNYLEHPVHCVGPPFHLLDAIGEPLGTDFLHWGELLIFGH